ncbi:hypothetical protein SDRG_00301 [Saprolegnia diclina VS20]|uniref:ABC transporter domain-containing protein n=1 Tax=Saprolegnia diclina (strain VS20) TaxID=1156394 RepID=T0R6M8_SAPDV|nr:hypothetical protein SDRG_00301 [Saprolegnia diclina VS20]EQC42571.1 hypothetical protein SDRG_00301 [Saprolegnia diclina VS20]|eukprot:XP_008603994.1 hypothetical protein SDRG_00301 [Saprolegnia diclina VS20]
MSRHHVRTLLWKNALLKKRHPIRLGFELVLPVVFIVILGILKGQAADITVPSGWSDNMESTFSSSASIAPTYSVYQGYPATSPAPAKFAATEATISGLLLRLSTMSLAEGRRLDDLSATDRQRCSSLFLFNGAINIDPTSPYAVPTACAGKVVPYKLAIVPDTAYTRAYFAAAVNAWYPRVPLTNASSGLVIPSFVDALAFYHDEAALENYVSGGSYGQDLSHPKIYAAIVFDVATPRLGTAGALSYTLRFNATSGDAPSTAGAGVDPNQKALAATPYQRYPTPTLALLESYVFRYARNGFLALQTLLTRFAACVPSWNGSAPGACTVAGSTSVQSDLLDDRFMVQVQNDDALLAAVAAFNKASGASLTLRELSFEARRLLLVPLRQAPQPYFGGLVLPLPISAYTASPFFATAGDFFSFVFVVSYVQLVTGLLVALVKEKETRAREMMKVLGVTDGAIVGSWMLTYGIVVLVVAALQTIASSQLLFPHTSPLLLYLFFALFGFAVVAFGFFMSTFFSRPRTGAFLGLVVFLLLFLLGQAFSTSASEGAKALGCLAPPVAMSFGISALARAEVNGGGITWHSAHLLDSHNIRFDTALYMLALDTLLLTLVGFYFEKVIPKDYGVPEHWTFPLQWLYRSRGVSSSATSRMSARLLAQHEPPPHPYVEAVTDDLKQQERTGDALQIQCLRKAFLGDDKIEKVAVHGLQLTLYKNQITCLLGHNGAGKTTLLSMLTGMLPPTSGDATLLRGLSLRSDMHAIRQSIGMCPQHDVLYDELSVYEHLAFYGRIKGCDEAELDQKLRAVGLTEKRHTPSKALSGGMKRKLSLAIAFLGDSQIVFLDEPTSGMDPYSRRHMWETVLSHRQHRIIVLTTHSMDEADILGDRIAILADGELRCAGSSLYLKQTFGAGYNLSLVTTTSDHLADLSSLVVSFVSSAALGAHVGTDVTYQLPLESAPRFPELFAALDAQRTQLGVESYGISVTTLEQVFLTVAEAPSTDGDDGDVTRSQPSDLSPTVDTSSVFRILEAAPMSKAARFLAHFQALWRKRYLCAKRDRKIVTFSTLWPAVYIAIGMLLLTTSATRKNDPPIEMSTRALPLGAETPLPWTCLDGSDAWCDGVTRSIRAAAASSLPLITYPTSTPTVFDVPYTINASDTSGYCLSMAQTSLPAVLPTAFGRVLLFTSASSQVVGYALLSNTTATHAPSIYKAAVDDALVRWVTQTPTATVVVMSHPLPLTQASKLLSTTILSFTATSFIVVAMAYFSASIVPFLVQERHVSTNVKHQQLLAGVSIPAFWLANLAWDCTLYLVPAALALGAIQIFDITPYTGVDCATCATNAFAVVVALFVLAGVAVVGFSYCASFLCKEPAEAQGYIINCNIYLGVYLMLVSTILGLVPSTESLNDTLVFVFRLSPLFCLGNGLYSLSLRAIIGPTSGTVSSSAFSTENAGWSIVYLAIEAILYPSLAIAIDYLLCFPSIAASWRRRTTRVSDEHDPSTIDHDVDVEAARVRAGNHDDAVVMTSLRKTYPDGKVAVADLSLGLGRGECFGFLGINGAGKTTTMKMLTGDILPTSGAATLGGHDLLSQPLAVRRLIGYCPQFDALFDLLSVREHLELFAVLKGVPGPLVKAVVTEKLSQLHLEPFATKLAKTLSGGNKRKLSVAIALIGAPPLLFLDEPSTGVDPVSRRFLWNVLADLSTKRKAATIFLTTHSMEECEALCTRVGIMVGGRLRCLGSIQHLKSRFGDGLLLHLKLKPVATMVDDATETAMDREAVATYCTAHGRPDRVHLIRDDHPTGYTLADSLARDGSVFLHDVSAWWRREDRYDACISALQASLGETNVSVVERHLDVCRLKIIGDNMSLGRIFGLIEEKKAALHIREYTVSQTTLEQIFNSFASAQVDEVRVARGVAA